MLRRNHECHVTNKLQERKDLLLSRVMVEGEVHGSATHCSVEDEEERPPYMQDDPCNVNRCGEREAV